MPIAVWISILAPIPNLVTGFCGPSFATNSKGVTNQVSTDRLIVGFGDVLDRPRDFLGMRIEVCGQDSRTDDGRRKLLRSGSGGAAKFIHIENDLQRHVSEIGLTCYAGVWKHTRGWSKQKIVQIGNDHAPSHGINPNYYLGR